jgi:hypothetical protein
VTTARFDGRARLVSGSASTASAVAYRVTLAAGSLRLSPEATDGTVLDVPVTRLRARPLGRAGSVVLEVDQSPLLLNFSDHEPPEHGAPAGARGRRLLVAGQGRRRRERFLRALTAETS